MRVHSHFEVARKPIKPQISLLLLGPMAADAMVLQKGFKRFHCAYGTGEAEISGQAPSSSGWSMPSHINLVAPLRPA